MGYPLRQNLLVGIQSVVPAATALVPERVRTADVNNSRRKSNSCINRCLLQYLHYMNSISSKLYVVNCIDL